MPAIKKLHIIIICCINAFFVHADGLSSGLLFTSSAEKVDKRTSLVIFGDKFQRFEDSFHIDFNLSIWDINQFGHVLRIINDKKQEVEFVFVNFYGIDNMYLDFHSPITHKSVQIPITKEDIDQKTILHLDICFDLKNDKASITLKDSVYTCMPVGLENPSMLSFAFGLYRLNLDVPQMLIGNIHIQAANNKSFFFPLDESEGELAHDKTKKINAYVKNPEWMINKHFYWQARAKFKITDNTGTTYDEANNRIVIADNDSVVYFYPRYNRTEIVKTVKDVPVYEGHLLHSSIFQSSNGDLYQFGGYGNHSYSDKISRYDNETRQWNFIDFKGSKITPRFYSAVGDGVHPDEKLIFGGFGNETGKQEHGGHNLYDLYLLNLKQKTITNLWNIREIPKTEFIPGNNLILSEDKKYFYALCYAHHLPNTTAYLYRFDLQNGTCDIMSDSIVFMSENINTSVNLFYNKPMREFYAVIREFSDKNETNIRIHSLLSPPITKSQLENTVPLRPPYRMLLWLIPLAVSLVAVYIFLRFLRKKNNKNILPDNDEHDQKIQKKSAVYIFGNFTVYDKNGIDISYRFSMKLRALFSLLLLNTGKETGISTDKLTAKLWPDKDINGAKSIRGVTINRLRNILENIEGLSLVHKNHQWFFVFEQPFYCDYLEYSAILSRLQSPEQESYASLMEQLIAIITHGHFLLNVQDTGIDDYKTKEEEKLEQLLREYIVHLYEGKQYQKIISRSSAYFAVELLNKDILDICIKAYHKQGKNEEAKTFLKNYMRTYKKFTGEDYKG
jgi:two-component SAPR family response regulator